MGYNIETYYSKLTSGLRLGLNWTPTALLSSKSPSRKFSFCTNHWHIHLIILLLNHRQIGFLSPKRLPAFSPVLQETCTLKCRLTWTCFRKKTIISQFMSISKNIVMTGIEEMKEHQWIKRPQMVMVLSLSPWSSRIGLTIGRMLAQWVQFFTK